MSAIAFSFSFLFLRAVHRNVSILLALETFEFGQIHITCMSSVFPTTACTTSCVTYCIYVPDSIPITCRHVIVLCVLICSFYLIQILLGVEFRKSTLLLFPSQCSGPECLVRFTSCVMQTKRSNSIWQTSQ